MRREYIATYLTSDESSNEISSDGSESTSKGSQAAPLQVFLSKVLKLAAVDEGANALGHNGCKRGGDRDKGLPLEILLFHGSSTNQLSDALSNYWGEAGSNGNESLPLEIRVHSLKILKLSSVDQSTDALADGGSKSAGDGQKSLPLKVLVFHLLLEVTHAEIS